MFVIKLPNGNLLVPESALDAPGEVMGDAYVEISPSDSEYARRAADAVTDEVMAPRRRRWQDGDEALGREFEAFRAAHAGQGPGGDGGGPTGC